MDVLPVLDLSSKKVDEVELEDGIFNFPIKGDLIHRAVVMQRASERQGTASTIGRGEVSGGGKKPWKQKHTGRARAGSSRSPIWRGGGTVFGPRPRTYSSPLPRKMYRAALKGALASKFTSGNLIVLENLTLPEMKTRHLVQSLLQVGGKGKVVLVIEEGLKDLLRIGKNVKNLKILQAQALNVYDVLWCDTLVVTRTALQRIQAVWV